MYVASSLDEYQGILKFSQMLTVRLTINFPFSFLTPSLNLSLHITAVASYEGRTLTRRSIMVTGSRVRNRLIAKHNWFAFLIYICSQQTNTKDLAGQSASQLQVTAGVKKAKDKRKEGWNILVSHNWRRGGRGKPKTLTICRLQQKSQEMPLPRKRGSCQ